MPIIQHLGTAYASGGGIETSPDPFGDGSCRSYYPLDSSNGTEDIVSGHNFDNWGGLSWATGKQGTHCWNGDGSNWMQVTGSAVGNVSNYTLNFWYKCSQQSQSNKRLVTLRAASYTCGWSNYAGSLGFYTGNGNNYTTSVTRRRQLPDGWVNDGQWYMLTATMTSGNSWEIYLNGSQTNGSSNQGDGRSFNDGSYLAMTCYNASGGYNTQGLVDNLRIFNRVLSASEIANLYSWENV
tara:strand:- start:122 stop:835 length:714 start_codon:yes stop_codon:yes gene_type:complete